MKTRIAVMMSLLVLALVFLAACSFTSTASDFNGLNGPEGQPVKHMSTTNVGINLLFSIPILGKATMPKTVEALTAKAKTEGASQVRIVQSGSTPLWYVFPPFSFVVHPVITNVAADAR
ncbi:MAG: hypothetical protein ACOC54_03920 [Candidatus Sumerlaeota bacterium]